MSLLHLTSDERYLILRGPVALKKIRALILMYTMSLSQDNQQHIATPQTLNMERVFITSGMHIHWQVDGARGGMCMTSQHSAECRSRRRMLIQLYGSCSLVPMATVFALEQKSCIRSLAIKDHCQACEWGLPVTKSHQQYFKELLMLTFGLIIFGAAAK